MNQSLETYLHDHLAGANLAINLLEAVLKKPTGAPMEAFLSSLLENIAEDRDALKTLADRMGVGTSRLKELAAWAGEKITQIKLGSADSVSFEIFEALELVQLGVRGKLQMWHALLVASSTEERLRGVDYEGFIARAEAQYAAVEARRLSLVPSAFGRAI